MTVWQHYIIHTEQDVAVAEYEPEPNVIFRKQTTKLRVEDISQLGTDGWQMVTKVDSKSYVFKRPKPYVAEKAPSIEI